MPAPPLPAGAVPVAPPSGGPPPLPAGATPYTPPANPPPLPQGATPVSTDVPAAAPIKTPGKVLPVVPTRAADVNSDYNSDFISFGKGGIRPEFRGLVQQLTGMGHVLGVYDFSRGHHYAAGDPHLDGRAMDVDTLDGRDVGATLDPRAVNFISDALHASPNVSIGIGGPLYAYFKGQADFANRVFKDEPTHIHVQLDNIGAPNKLPPQQHPLSTNPRLSNLPPAHAQQQNAMQSVWNMTANAAQGIKNAAVGAAQGVESEWVYYKDHPLELPDALLGSVQRFVAGAGADPDHRITHYLGTGLYDMFHPRDADAQQQSLQGLLRAFHMPTNDTGLKRAAEVLFAQSITDPLTLAGGLGVFSKLSKVSRMTDLMTGAWRGAEAANPQLRAIANAYRNATGAIANNRFVKGTQRLLATRPELDEHLEPGAKAARLGIENHSYSIMRPLEESDAKLLDAHKAALQSVPLTEKGAVLPDAIRQRYLREPFVYGTPAMRAKAIELGYKPLAGEAERAPMGLLEYNVREDYQTLIKPFDKSARNADDALFRVSGGRYNNAADFFEKARNGKEPISLGENQYEITENRLRMGRDLIRKRMVDHQTEEYLKAYGGWRGSGKPNVDALSHESKSFNSPMKGISQWGKESVLGTPFPHGLVNVGQLAYLRGGPIGFGKGIAYALRGLSTDQADRLARMGADAHYMNDLVGPWKHVPGMQQYINFTQKALSRLEGGYRQALLDSLDSQWGRDTSDMALEYKKSQEIRDALGDYRNVNSFIAGVQALGGPFVVFRLGIVPKATMKAVRERPWNLEALSRGQSDIQQGQDAAGDDGQFHMGGPVEDFTRMLTNPFGYAGSPATIGPLSYPLLDAAKVWARQPIDLPQDAESALRNYGGPLTGTIGKAFGFPIPDPGQEPLDLSNPLKSFDLRAALQSFFGTYTARPPSFKAEQKQYRAIQRQGGN